MLFFDFIYFLVRNIVLIYPIIKTIQGIKTPRNEIMLRWLTYWFIVGILTNLGIIGYYLPFYGTVELILIVILQNKYFLNIVKRYLILNLVRDAKRMFKKFQNTNIYQSLENNHIIFLIIHSFQYLEMING